MTEYWLILSFEEAGKYPTDIHFVSDRSEMPTLEELRAEPTFALLPAAKAGQVYSWSQNVTTSYKGLARTVNHASESISTSDPTVGENLSLV